MSQIAAAAGVTRRTLYNQFANAEELFRAAHEALLLEVSAMLPLGVSGRFSPPAALRTYCSMLVQAFADPRYGILVGFIVRDSWCAPWLADTYNHHVRTPLARSIETYVQALRSQHALSGADARGEALNLLASIEAIVSSSTLLPGIDQLRPSIADCAADFIDGFMARVNRQPNGGPRQIA